jgi:hypothetical protein
LLWVKLCRISVHNLNKHIMYIKLIFGNRTRVIAVMLCYWRALSEFFTICQRYHLPLTLTLTSPPHPQYIESKTHELLMSSLPIRVSTHHSIQAITAFNPSQHPSHHTIKLSLISLVGVLLRYKNYLGFKTWALMALLVCAQCQKHWLHTTLANDYSIEFDCIDLV